MRLRELTFPIVVRKPNLLMGGKNADLHKVTMFDFNRAKYFLDGGYDDAILYDSEGREFTVAKIILRKPDWWRYLLRRLDNLTILPLPDKTDMVKVDFELQQMRQLSLDQFFAELREVALAHPAWWKRHSSKKEIEEMFQGCETFPDAINDIGVLDPPGKEKLPGRSSKIVDLR